MVTEPHLTPVSGDEALSHEGNRQIAGETCRSPSRERVRQHLEMISTGGLTT
jgi:hypothetical protein